MNKSNEDIIRKVLEVDHFEIHYLKFENDTVSIGVTNKKFRSTAQALGRVASTLQRFTADEVLFAAISFYSKDLQAASYRVDLEEITSEQFHPPESLVKSSSITAINVSAPHSERLHPLLLQPRDEVA